MDRASPEVTASGGIGDPLRAAEAVRFIRGQGRYIADLRLPGTLHLAFVRSPHAHARIRQIDTRAVSGRPGILAILTALDVPPPPAAATSPETRAWPAPLLAQEYVYTVGAPVVAVVAETPELAADAAELIDVTYDPLPAVTDLELAADPRSPLVHPELGTNVAFTLQRGEGDVDAAFRAADVTVSARIAIPRLAGVPMEPLGVLASWDESAGTLTIWCTSQAPWRVHGAVTAALQLAPERVRVIIPDVGGGFGVRGPVYGEYLVAAIATRRLGRPVRWIATRREDFLVTQASREMIATAELAANREGRFLGFRARVLTNLGAYSSSFGPAHRIVGLLTGAYDIPAARVEVSGVYTNTGPTGAYRGAGRPEAAFVIEQLVERMAAALGMDPIALRRRNFIPPEAFPYRTPLGTTFDSGNYAEALDRALALVQEPSGEAPSPDTSEAELVGTGVISYIEPTGGGWESGRVRVEADGRVTVISGSVAHGQGHHTAFAQIAASRLSIPPEMIEVREGDTADALPGVGTFGSRSAVLGGGAIAAASEEIFARAREEAARLLEARPEDVTAHDGRFHIVGVSPTERSVSWNEVVRSFYARGASSQLDAQIRFELNGEAFAFGTCVAVVGIDPATGQVRLRRLAIVHDCGRVINPRLVAAQLHGGLAQGAGEALGEWIRYDDGGQLLTGSLLDYWIPRADDLPSFELASTVTPSPLNPLGIKGVGEAGTIAAPAAIASAVLAALRPLGVAALDMPFTPERVWRAIRAARQRA